MVDKYSYAKVHLDMTSNQVPSDVGGPQHIILNSLG